MKDKEKQIEETEHDIFHADDGCQQGANCHKIEELIKRKGYRKLPEDSVVLSREEYEKLLAQRRKARSEMKRFKRKYLYTKEELKQAYKKGSKETAEKYKVAMMLCIQEMQKYLEITEEQAKILYHYNAEIAKQFSVGIKKTNIEDRCVICGELVPEGRDVCPQCETRILSSDNRNIK